MTFDNRLQHLAWWMVVIIETVPLILLVYAFAMWVTPVAAKREAWSTLTMSLYVIAGLVRWPAWWGTVHSRWWIFRWLTLDLLLAAAMLVIMFAMQDVPGGLVAILTGVDGMTHLTDIGPRLFVSGVVIIKLAAVVLYPLTAHRSIVRAEDRVEKIVNRWENYSTPGPTSLTDSSPV